jgi:hypothetical protein
MEEAQSFPHSETASIKDVAAMSSPSSEHVPDVIINGSPHKKEIQAPSLSSASDQQVYQAQGAENLDLRLSQLEYNMQQLNRSVHSASSQEQPQTFKLEKPPKGPRMNPGLPSTPRSNLPIRSPSVTQHSSSPSTISQEDKYLTPSQNNNQTPATPSFSLSKDTSDRLQPQTLTLPQPPVHNFSTPLTPALPSPKSHDNLTPVYNALRYERAVRKQLEIQVLQLQRDLLQLTTVVAQMRGVHAYPFTPSPDNGAKGDDMGDEIIPDDWRMPRDGPGVGSGWRGDMF